MANILPLNVAPGCFLSGENAPSPRAISPPSNPKPWRQKTSPLRKEAKRATGSMGKQLPGQGRTALLQPREAAGESRAAVTTPISSAEGLLDVLERRITFTASLTFGRDLALVLSLLLCIGKLPGTEGHCPCPSYRGTCAPSTLCTKCFGAERVCFIYSRSKMQA